MSEEFLQVIPSPVGRFTYWPTRASSLTQLAKLDVIRRDIDPDLALKKPDGLIVDNSKQVVAVIEYKQPSALSSDKQIKSAIAQEIGVARSLGAMLIVTDNAKSFWVNSYTGNYILSSNGNAIDTVLDVRSFQGGTLTSEMVSKFETLLGEIRESVGPSSDAIAPKAEIDPSALAKALWQKIWVCTGKEPEKCLYNVVELFVFKFLSDLGVLSRHSRFEKVIEIRRTDGAEQALEMYAAVCRKEIRNLFPAGADGTTVINGTIFVNEIGQANLAQSTLFGEVIDLLAEYEKHNGSFRNIKRDFKTRLYESFLRQSAGIKSMGQYFTPRNVVLAMVRMSNVMNLQSGSRICDPFAGVGGFLLEAMAECPTLMAEFEPKNGIVNPRISLIGFDKGSDEKDDERTIILAKANMLIYFSDLLVNNHSKAVLKEFSDKAFNKVFTLIRSNLGTFSKTTEEPCDLILTNPPYVTSGSSSLKKEISDRGLSNYYSIAGRGTESLAISWVVQNLKPGGQAFLVVPDGLLSQKSVLDYISKECFVRAVIALPAKTFYSTPKKTYILAIEKKQFSSIQTDPIFAYVVGEIGETRDSYRFQGHHNDLPEMVGLYNMFKGAPKSFSTVAPRCRTVSAVNLLSSDNWWVDRLWTDSEKKAAGIQDTITEVSTNDFLDQAKNAFDPISKFVTTKHDSNSTSQMGDFFISDLNIEFIPTKTGWSKSEYRKIESGDPKDIPIYSASKGAVAFTKSVLKTLIPANQEAPVISFASNGDGSAGTNFVYHTTPFYVSTDRTCIRVNDPSIDSKYLLASLHGMKETYDFNHSNKATRENLSKVSVKIPLNSDGSFDLNSQKLLAFEFFEFIKLKIDLESKLEEIKKSRIVLHSN